MRFGNDRGEVSLQGLFLGVCHPHHQPAARRAGRLRHALARSHQGGRAADDAGSGLVAALLAIGEPGLDWRWLVLALIGITLAHVANNLMNDLFDTQVGTDSASYPRALYAPHPVLSGLVSRRTLLISILLVNVADLAILVVLTLARGWPVLAFALAGFVLSVAYTAPPLRLKKHGLGEPDVFVVWGPLMVCGTYYSAVGLGRMGHRAGVAPVRAAVHDGVDG